METERLRRAFLEYFRNKGHRVVPSSPVIPHDDPTLLFTNAGMNQFKDVFLGLSARDYLRATSSQKCIRVGGKHNDLENVGHTKRHLTFFEMLGNFSFGDYFKEEAVRFAWEVATQCFGFDGDRIWPTVFREDDEAFELWKQYVPEKRICRFGEKENYWEMGDTGPCGPCSELLYDRGAEFGKGTNPYEDPAGDRFLEFWNLVFMQKNRDESGTLRPLPKPSVDTGAGLERVVALKMGVDNVFETDILRAVIGKVEEVSGVRYEPSDERQAPAFRVIADHLRTLAFAIADGAQPSNVDRGYVLRKVLRRAVRYGRQLGMDRPFLANVLPRLVEVMGGDYKELVVNSGRIGEIVTVEEEAFLRTLRRGGNLLSQIIDHATASGKTISGEEAFKLKDTYGLPLDEILLLAKDAALTVDTDRFQLLEEEARERSRQAHKATKQVAEESLFSALAEKHGATKFTGYEGTEGKGTVLAIVVGDKEVERVGAGEEALLLLDSTPFYAEKGGQVGDLGLLKDGGKLFAVIACQSPYKGLIAHIGTVKEGTIARGDKLAAAVDKGRRQQIANNHTATHLLHWALQKVLGAHIKQAGSVVDAERLRFDFSHHKALTDEELRAVEDLVNAKIRANSPVASYELAYDEAQKSDEIKQFFGDKYDSIVRVVDIDGFSKELCGGTHTGAVGNIGFFRIAKEGSVAAGVRRIEAVTGAAAEALARESDDRLNALASQLKAAPMKLQGRVEKLLEEIALLKEENESLRRAASGQLAESLLAHVERVSDRNLLVREVAVDAKELRPFAEELLKKMGSGIVLLGAAGEEGRCQLVIQVSDDLVGQGISAVTLVKEIAPIIGGSGGGKAQSAQAGGKEPQRIAEALAKARELLSV